MSDVSREETIEIFEMKIELEPENEDLYKMAINSLRQAPSGDLISREETLTAFADYVGSGMSMDDFDALWSIVAKMPAVNSQEPCGDAISRQSVLKTLDDMNNVLDEDRTIENYKELLKECYEVLPSVNPQEPIWCKDCTHNNNCDIQYHAQAGDMFYCGAGRK